MVAIIDGKSALKPVVMTASFHTPMLLPGGSVGIVGRLRTAIPSGMSSSMRAMISASLVLSNSMVSIAGFGNTA